MPRLRPADAAWIGMRHVGGPMVIDALLRLEGDLSGEDVVRLLADRVVPTFPQLRTTAPLGDLRRAVTERVLDGPLTEAATESTRAAVVADPLPSGGWRIVVVRSAPGACTPATALVVRLHHSLGDGAALMAVLDALLDPSDAPARAPRARPPRWLGSVAGAVALVPVGLGVVLSATRARLPLADAGSVDVSSWTRPHDLAALKAAAALSGASVNDVLLAAVAGALRAHVLGRGGEPRDARVIVPVDLRHAGTPVTRLGNHLGVLLVRLPVSVEGASARLAAVRRTSRGWRWSPQPQATWLLLQAVGLLPAAVQELAGDLLGAAVDGIVTNVPGPREVRALDGRVLRSVLFWVPRVGSAPLGVSLLSYAGSVVVGVTGVPATVAALVDDELARLAGCDA